MPNYSNTSYDIGKAFAAIEDELMASMVRNLKRHKLEEINEDKQWSMWQAEQLKSLERYKRDNRKKYGKQFQSINKQIGELLRISHQEGGMEQEQTILRAIQRGYRFPHMPKRILDLLEEVDGMSLPDKISSVLKKLKTGNVSRGTAEFFKLNDRKLSALIKATTNDMQNAETAVLRMANDQYRQVIYNAQVYANTGAGTYEKAVDMATKDFLSRGINCIQYKNGARHTIADYADMAIRTASKRAYLQGEGEKRQEWGISTVIMNKRGNPCPLCLPFVGKVFIDDVWSGGKKTDGDYPLLSSAIAKGLYHPRCKDSHTTYFSEISTPPEAKYTKEELKQIEQENQVEARQQYAERQAGKYARLSEYSFDDENKKRYLLKGGEWKDKVKSPEYLPVNNWEGLDLDTMMQLNDELSIIPEIHQDFLEDAGVTIEIIDEGVSFYDPRDRVVHVTKDFEPYEVVHEVAHALEDVGGIWEDVEFKELVRRVGESHHAKDIINDTETFVKPVRRIDDPRLISIYQGRIYSQYGETMADGTVNPDSLWDYFSEGYRCFFEDPELLFNHDPDLFEYVRRMVDG